MRMNSSSTKKPHDVYHWLDDDENLEGYVDGGYHPTHLGDELWEGRYRIVHKLCFGSYSTGTYLRLLTTIRCLLLAIMVGR